MTFPLLGKSYFFACAAMPRNRAKRGAKTAGAQSEDVPLFTRRRTGGEWVEIATLPHHQQAMPRNRAKRGAKTAGAQSEDVPLFTRCRTGGEWVEVATLPHHQQAIAAQSREARCKKQPERRALRPQARFGAQPPQAALGAEIGCSSVHPPPNRRRMGGGDNLALLLGGSSKPRTTANKLSPRRAKLALNVRIGCSCRAHNHHKFSHRILQPHTKRRASHAD